MFNDIALIILANPVILDSTTQIACLPSSESSIYPSTATSAYLVGWVIKKLYIKF
jgi:hypothetical protein